MSSGEFLNNYHKWANLFLYVVCTCRYHFASTRSKKRLIEREGGREKGREFTMYMYMYGILCSFVYNNCIGLMYVTGSLGQVTQYSISHWLYTHTHTHTHTHTPQSSYLFRLDCACWNRYTLHSIFPSIFYFVLIVLVWVWNFICTYFNWDYMYVLYCPTICFIIHNCCNNRLLYLLIAYYSGASVRVS